MKRTLSLPAVLAGFVLMSAGELACVFQRPAVLEVLCRVFSERGVTFGEEEALFFWTVGTPHVASGRSAGLHDDIFGGASRVEDRTLTILELLVNCGADISVRGPEEGWSRPRAGTALHEAVATGRGIPAVTKLIEAGADANARDLDDRTALHWAIGMRREPRVVSVLLDSGADADARDGAGDTALHYACRYWGRRSDEAWEASGEPALLELIASMTDVDAVDGDGATPLQLAVERRAFDLARVLAAAGADTTLKCHRDVPECRRLALTECVRRIERGSWWDR